MKREILALVISLLTWNVSFSQKNIMTTIHCDIKGGITTPAVDNVRYNDLKTMVDSATSRNIKLTIMLNPYFCEIILSDTNKYNDVQTWMSNGHEIAGLHRGLTHYEWDGYTDLPNDSIIAYNSLSNYIGPMNIFNQWLDSIAQHSIHMYATFDQVTEFDWKSGAYIQGKGDGPSALPSGAYFDVQQNTVKQGSIAVCQVKYYFIDNTAKVAQVTALYNSQSEQNVGVVTHPTNFASNPSYFYNWLNFVESQQNSLSGTSKTASDIVQNSTCASILSVSESEININNSFFIYPNPTQNNINILGNNQNSKIDYNIYSITGDLLISSTLVDNTICIDKLPAGLYLLTLTAGTKTQTLKFIKNGL